MCCTSLFKEWRKQEQAIVDSIIKANQPIEHFDLPGPFCDPVPNPNNKLNWPLPVHHTNKQKNELTIKSEVKCIVERLDIGTNN